MRNTLFIVMNIIILCSSTTAQTFQEVEKIVANDGAAGDFYGTSVSISGDYAVVGSIDDVIGGSAYIYSKDQGGANNWGLVKKIKANDPANFDRFGFSVSISGENIVVGSRSDDDNGSSTGSAYIYSKDQGGINNWGLIKKIKASDAAGTNYFGNSVSISNDIIVVGSFGNLGSTGSAYIFSRHVGGFNNWGEVKRLIASDGELDDRFGLSVANHGDYAIVGSQLDDDNGSNTGAAYIFYKDEGGFNNWGEVTKLLPADGGSSDDWFGWEVAMSGDHAVVTNLRDDDLGTNSGSAYIFNKNLGGNNNWGQVTKLLADDGSTSDAFGRNVSIDGDVVVIGSIFEGDSMGNPGSAYVFSKDNGGNNNWGQSDKLIPSDGSSGDLFGLGISISGDYILIGSIYDDDQGIDSGSAYFFKKVLCSPNLTISANPIPSNTYQAGLSINSTSIVPANGDVQFAASTICLDLGFEVISSGEFEALINPCSN